MKFYKRVIQEDKHLTKLINKENKKIDIKINQKLNIESEIIKVQNEMKDILQNINILNDQIFEQQKELEKKSKNQRPK